MTDINLISIDDQELTAIIYCINNGKQLDEYESGIVNKLIKIKRLRIDVKIHESEAANTKSEILST